MRQLTRHPKSASDANGLVHWWRAYNPARVGFNYVIVHLAAHCPSMRLKNTLYRTLGARIGKDVRIAPGVILDFFNPELIEIDEGTVVGFQALIMAHEFLVDGHATGRTIIGPHCLIGARSTILAGVRIGAGAQVGAMALVNHDVPARTLVGGVPARVIQELK